MSTILVVDDMPICREPIEAALLHAGFDTNGVSSGAEALAQMNAEQPALVLLDMNMPGLDGMSVLRAMRKNPRLRDVKVVFLTDTADKNRIVEAGALGIQGYLLKANFSLDELLTRVRHLLDGSAKQGSAGVPAASPQVARADAKHSASALADHRGPENRAAAEEPRSVASLDDLSPLLTKASLYRLVKQGLDLKPLGPSVHSVLSATGSSNCCADDVADAVGQDQALAVRILKLANSSMYGRGRPVDTVKSAAARIGVKEVRKLVMALGVLDHFKDRVTERMDPRLFWEHSIGTGLIASAIARACGRTDVEDAFLWGMLHDVGRLVMLEQIPDKYAAVFDAADALDLPLEVVEPKLMLLDHCDILEQALDHWKFPREVIAPTVGHHCPAAKIKRGGAARVNGPGIIALANRMAHALLLGSSGNDTIYPLDDLVEPLGLEPSLIKQIVEEIPSETNALKFSMVANSNEDSWPDFASDIKQRLSTPIRPLCVSAKPTVDAYRILCERIADYSQENQPNLGVIYLRDSATHAELFDQFVADERQADCDPLPVVLICTEKKVNLPHAALQSRNHVILKTPVRLAAILGAFRDLLG